MKLIKKVVTLFVIITGFILLFVLLNANFNLFERIDNGLMLNSSSKDSNEGLDYYNKLNLYLKQDLLDSIPNIIDVNLKYAEKNPKSPLAFDIYKTIGFYYLSGGKYANSLESFQNALKHSKEETESKDMADVYIGIAGIYFYLDDYQQASIYCELAYNIYSKSNNEHGLASYYANMGGIYSVKNEENKAIYFLIKSLDIAEKFNDSLTTNHILNSLALIAVDQKDYSLAASYLERADKLSTQLNNAEMQAYVLSNYGELNKAKGLYNEAVSYYEQSNKIVNKASLRIKLINFKSLAHIAEQQGNYQTSNNYLKEYYLVYDQMKGINVVQETEKIKWQNAINEQNYKQKLSEQRLRFRNYLYSVFILLAIVGLVLIWYMYKNKSNRLKIFKLQNKNLEEAVKIEKELKVVQETMYQNELESLHKELTSLNIIMLSKNDFLNELNKIIDSKNSTENASHKLIQLKQAISNMFNIEKDWKQFKQVFQQIHPNFFERLQSDHPQITTYELRICAYIKINMSNNEIASLLNITHKSLITSRYRIRKKLSLDTSENLDKFIQEL